MTAQREGQKTWLDVFPFEQELGCVALREKYPDIPGRVILQDLAPVVAQAIPAKGVEAIPHDFWTQQPVKGTLAVTLRYKSNRLRSTCVLHA